MRSNQPLLLTGIFLGMFFAALDQTVVGTALPRIIGDLGGLSMMTWVTTAYMLASATIVPIAGKCADLFGRRIVYLIGISVFMLGSALCGTSHNMVELIIYRGIQGLGGGTIMPLAMIIIGDIFTPEKRAKWQGVIGGVFGLASIVGPTVGGWIVDYSSWHWVFYVNLPIGLLTAAAIFWGLQGEQQRKHPVVIDYWGAFTLVIGIVSLLLALNLGGVAYAWHSWQIISLAGASIIFITVFGYIEKMAIEPILSLDLFHNRVFSIVNTLGFLMGMGMFGSLMFLPLFLQGVAGISATKSGNTLIPMMLAMVCTSTLGGRILTKVSFRTMFVMGMSLTALGFFLLSTMNIQSPQSVAITYVILLGCGMGLIMPTATIAVQSSFSYEMRGIATSSTQFFRSIGGSLGMTILGAVFNYRSGWLLNSTFLPSVADKQLPGLDMITTKAQSDPHGLFNLLLNPASINQLSPEIQRLILFPLKVILADALHIVFFIAMVITLVGIGVSLLLGDAGIGKKTAASKIQEAGRELLAEEACLTPDSQPDLVDE
jgi:EmrB/QacA subfamily drug resistance transporter